MATRDAPKAPPALRALQARLEDLEKSELEVQNQLTYLSRELRRHRRHVIDLEDSNDKLKSSYGGISKAKVASLPEYHRVKLLVGANNILLDKSRSEIKKITKSSQELADRLKDLQKQLKSVRHEVSTWNKLVRLRDDR